MISLRSLVPALALAGSLVLSTSPARADVSSWLFAGFGPSSIIRKGTTDVRGSLQLDAGVGSSPAGAFAMGGLVRAHVHFGGGADFGLFWRTATGGYVRGNWGAALDLGGYVRTWTEGSPGAAGTISLGAPLGIVLNLDAGRGRDDVTTLAAVIGFDFARFTIYRETGTNWFPNPFPSPPLHSSN
jgi:hypothetical protein